jgi:hypothetical protein
MTWILVVVGVIVVLIVIGALASRGDRKNAPVKLAEAKAAWSAKDRPKTLECLAKAYWPGASAPEQTATSLEAVQLTEEVIKSLGLVPDDLTRAVREALAAKSAEPEKPAERLKKFLEKAAQKPENLWGAWSEVDTPFIDADMEDRGADKLEDGQRQTIIKIGRSLVFGSATTTLGEIEAQLSAATGQFRGELLHLRGACHSSKPDLALDDYRASAELVPDDASFQIDVAETLVCLGRAAEAKAAVEKALAVAKTAKEREKMTALLRRFP